MPEDTTWQDESRALFEAVGGSVIFWVIAGLVFVVLVGAYSGGKSR